VNAQQMKLDPEILLSGASDPIVEEKYLLNAKLKELAGFERMQAVSRVQYAKGSKLIGARGVVSDP